MMQLLLNRMKAHRVEEVSTWIHPNFGAAKFAYNCIDVRLRKKVQKNRRQNKKVWQRHINMNNRGSKVPFDLRFSIKQQDGADFAPPY
jgi:hypothetical protein